MDIAGLASTVSKAVIITESAESVADSVRAAVAACALPGPVAAPATPAIGANPELGSVGGTRVVTLVMAHDHQWLKVPTPVISGAAQELGTYGLDGTASGESISESHVPTAPGLGTSAESAAVEPFIRDLAAALLAARGRSMILLGGPALLTEADDQAGTAVGGALGAAGRVSAAAGAALYCETFYARADRGAGRPALARLPYFPDAAQRELATYDLVRLVQARRPVGTFAYDKVGPGRQIRGIGMQFVEV